MPLPHVVFIPVPRPPPAVPPQRPLLCIHYTAEELRKPWWARAGYSGREAFPLDCTPPGEEGLFPPSLWRYSDAALAARGVPAAVAHEVFFPRLSATALALHREWRGSVRATERARSTLVKTARARCWRALAPDAGGASPADVAAWAGAAQRPAPPPAPPPRLAAALGALPLFAVGRGGRTVEAALRTWRTDAWGNVVAADAQNAALCGWDADHAFPFSRGGLTVPANLRALQFASNRWAKSDRLLAPNGSSLTACAVGVGVDDFVALYAACIGVVAEGGSAARAAGGAGPSVSGGSVGSAWTELHRLLASTLQRKRRRAAPSVAGGAALESARATALRRTSNGGEDVQLGRFTDFPALRDAYKTAAAAAGEGEDGAWARVAAAIVQRIERLKRGSNVGGSRGVAAHGGASTAGGVKPPPAPR